MFFIGTLDYLFTQVPTSPGNKSSTVLHFLAESLSDRFAIVSHNQINVVLSAQQLVDCDRKNYGCTGGWPSIAWQYIETVG